MLKGATYGPNIRRWMDTKRKANLGQCFIAVDPECFAPGFQTRMSDLMAHLRNMEPVITNFLKFILNIYYAYRLTKICLQADPEKPVIVAGDPERAHIDLVKSEGGIRYHVNQIKASVFAKSFFTIIGCSLILFMPTGEPRRKAQCSAHEAYFLIPMQTLSFRLIKRSNTSTKVFCDLRLREDV